MVTSSQDSTVKVWDLSNTRSPINVIRLPQVPAWKVRFTPFGGDGLVTLTMHTIQRCENNLMLWNISNASVPDPAPEHVFSGHIDMIMEFAWRKSDYFYEDRIYLSDDMEDNGNESMSHHQLVTWSKDNSLRIWTLEEIGREATEDVVRKEAASSSRPLRHSEPIMSSSLSSNLDTVIDSIQDDTDEDEKFESMNTSLPNFKNQTNLQQEFSLLNFGDRLILEKLDLNERYCSSAPLFSFMNPTTLDSEIRTQLLRKLKLTAHQQAAKARFCLEMCLRQFETAIENIYQIETESLKNQIPSPTDMIGVYQDTNIPFPRTSGARFCGMGQLVCFGFSPTIMIPIENKPKTQTKTPRAMSATNPPPGYYGQPSTMKTRRGVRFSRSVSLMGGQKSSISTSSESVPESGYQITIYDVLSISSVSKYLGERCLIADEETTVTEACSTNANLAASIGRHDIAKTWAIVSICAQVQDKLKSFRKQKELCRLKHKVQINSICSCPTQKNTQDDEEMKKFFDIDLPWAQHPFGRKLLDSLISHYIRQQDLQTAGLLLCNFL
ncbi:WDR59 [Lepeophtheirus salmonis]|uniref:WDR59 n=1 Tax=Lepeophtheirus salmonis TaxID=72036 RepID=A0A7R8H656_LEPSM|nr:WDR59 [Lepeophtheirus salmonis]CAF2881477.1 WDR59 [Lepeophtheirus salmonis]